MRSINQRLDLIYIVNPKIRLSEIKEGEIRGSIWRVLDSRRQFPQRGRALTFPRGILRRRKCFLPFVTPLFSDALLHFLVECSVQLCIPIVFFAVLAESLFLSLQGHYNETDEEFQASLYYHRQKKRPPPATT